MSIFALIIRHPRSILVASILLILVCAYFLLSLERDTRSDAFLSADNPALIYKQKIKKVFRLSDPIVMAVLDKRDSGIYNADTLQLLQSLTDEIRALPNIHTDRVTSLATAKNIQNRDDALELQPFLDPLPQNETQLAELREGIADFPLIQGSLVATDGHMTVIIAEMIDEKKSDQTYQELRSIIQSASLPTGVELHLAGEGAITGYLGSYIDSDALRLNPLAGLIINLIILLAFFRLTPPLLCNIVIGASVIIPLGIMAAVGTPFFVITNALPVILIGIAIADSIHIFNEYYTLQVRKPQMPVAELVVETMQHMWRPVALTSITTMCGFLGLCIGSYMPPFTYFGLYAALGVFIAWVYTMVFLPAAMVLTKPRVSANFTKIVANQGTDVLGSLLGKLGRFNLRHAGAVTLACTALLIAGIVIASLIVIDEDRINLFHVDEPIYKADKLINQHMNGTNVLDIVVETDQREGLLDTANLEKMEALQAYVQTIPNVGGTTSIVDYLKQINRALLDGSRENYQLPKSKESVAQYLLIYSALAGPTDLEEEIDYDYQTAIIRVNLKTGSYRNNKSVVEDIQHYIDTQFIGDGISATLSGRVSLNYHWFKNLGVSHFTGVAMSFLLVWGTCALLFLSPAAGMYALIPVAGSVIFVYASMVALGMTLGIGTSMFAAVAIGLGVDFAIYTLDRLQLLHRLYDSEPARIYTEFYLTTGRTLFFNFLAVACGFGVLIFSKIVSLNSFGSIVVLALTVSFISSLTLLPALVKLTQPKFIVGKSRK